VDAVAELAVRKAREHTGLPPEYRWSAFLNGYSAEADSKAKQKAAKTASKPTAKRAAKE
jgi:hypothetical protein